MNSSSLHSKLARFCWGHALLLLAALLTAFALAGFDPALVVFLVVGAAYTFWVLRSMQAPARAGAWWNGASSPM